jgi:hypothetical protein
MMPKVWLAVVLGIILGVGVAYSTASPVASPANMQATAQPFEGLRQTVQTTSPAQPNWQWALISLLAGIMVATPVFLVAKRPR